MHLEENLYSTASSRKSNLIHNDLSFDSRDFQTHAKAFGGI